tara:strand:+ start:1068 stop:2423 length:1356 start_codon:yes stop_codon:yes gene_type:complete
MIDVIILAAGQGSRMRSTKPKVLHEIGGKPMVNHVVDAALCLPDVSLHLVVGHGSEAVQASLTTPCHIVEQKEQLGTAHAVLQALPNLSPNAKVLILYADVPLIDAETLQRMVNAVDSHCMAVLTTELDDATGYGRIVRSDMGAVTDIVEHKDATQEQRDIAEINTGIMCVPQAYLSRWLPRIENNNAQHEYYLPDIIAMAVAEGVGIKTPQPKCFYEVEGVNNRQQLAFLERKYQQQISDRLMLEGVTLADPARIDIRGSLSVGQDVFIDINAVFSGNVVIGDGVSIGPNCVISDATIGAASEIYANTVIESATLGQQCKVGPFARLRPGAALANHVKVGNYVEVKNASLANGSKVNHLSYIGDAKIGNDTNVGAGTITCNYDGAYKHKTVLGDNVFIGSNSTLVAPLDIADGSFIGAGSTITEAVPKENLAIGRGRQKNIAGWKKPEKN